LKGKSENAVCKNESLREERCFKLRKKLRFRGKRLGKRKKQQREEEENFGAGTSETYPTPNQARPV